MRPRRAIITVLVVMVLIVSALAATALAQSDEVLPGVMVGGIPVTGLSRADLITKLRPLAKQAQEREVTLVAGEQEWRLSAEDFGISTDVVATADVALREGRTGPLSWFSKWLDKKRSEVRWVPRIRQPQFDQQIERLAEEIYSPAGGGAIRVSGSEVSVDPPSRGLSLIKAAAARRLKKALLNPGEPERVRLPVTVISSSITEDQVNRLREQADNLLASPIEFTIEGRSFTLGPQQVAAALDLRWASDPEEPSSGDQVIIQADPKRLAEQIIAAAPWTVSPAKDAAFVTDGQKASVVPAIVGTTVDGRGAGDSINRLRNLGGQRFPIPLSVVEQQPAFTTQQAEALGIKEKIATFSTPFDPRNAPRVGNIDLMATAVDGKLLRPGEEFSLNGTTGERTEARGYREAQIILDGELVPGVGGGVCQFASTLFNAVFFAGLDVTERSNHSLYISSYPVGRDATVYYGSKDLRFRNDTPHGILLRASVNPKSLTVSLYSSPLGRTVEYETSPRRTPKEPVVKYVDDPSLPAGQEVEQEPGSPGFDITVTRTVKAGDQVLHNDTFVSKYRAWKKIILRGTGPPAPSPSPAASPTV